MQPLATGARHVYLTGPGKQNNTIVSPRVEQHRPLQRYVRDRRGLTSASNIRIHYSSID